MEEQKNENTPERADGSAQINAVIRSLQARERKYRAWQDNSMLIQKETGVYGTMRFLSCLYEDCVLMQYTGLNDKNGKEIYEGDLVYDELLEENVYVTWNNGKYCAGQNSLSYVAPHCNLTGNIFETPELLG